MLRQRILVVEDDEQIRELIYEFLLSQDYEVTVAKDGVDGYQKIKESPYDLVILDIMMPNLDGYGLCQLIRQKDEKTPILFLTALGEEENEIKAFELKADDYITKPFSFNVLIKRVEAIIRRGQLGVAKPELDYIQFKELKLNLHTFKCYLGEIEIEMTQKEFNILKLLIENTPRVVTRELLFDQIWGYEAYGDMRVIDTHIKNIRKKIDYKYLKTVKGIGYVFEDNME